MRIKVDPDTASKQVRFKVYPNNWLARMFLPTLNLTYTPDRQLLRFEGYSNLIPAKGKGNQVVIDFVYHETDAVLSRPLEAWLPAAAAQVVAASNSGDSVPNPS